MTDFGRLRFELQCVSEYGHEILTIVEEWGEPSEDPLGGLNGWPGDIQLKAALLLSSQMTALRLANELEAERDRIRAELEAGDAVIRRLGFALQSEQAVKESLEDQIERLRVERDEALALADARGRALARLPDGRRCSREAESNQERNPAMTNPNALAALALAAQIRARIETGIVPYIPAEAETVAGLLEDLGGELQVTHEQYEAMAETIGELQARIAELEGVR